MPCRLLGTWSLHWRSGSLWTRIVNALLNVYDITYSYLCWVYFYASAKRWYYTYVLNTFHIGLVELHIYILLNMIGGLILVSHAPKRWYSAGGFLGVWQIGIRAIGYRELGFNMGKTILLKPDYNQNSALNDPQRRFAPRARLDILGNMVYVYYLLARIA